VNKEQRKNYNTNYKKINKKQIKKYNAEYYQKTKNKPSVKRRQEEYMEKNKEKYKEIKKEYRKNNKEKINLYRKKYLHKNIAIRIHNNLANRLRDNLRNKKNTLTILNYSIYELKIHLENQFTPRMNWNNYGTYWHIDHRIPISKFSIKTADDQSFKACWALENLQPLEAKKNLSKGNRYSEPTIKQIQEGVLELVT